MKTTAKVAKKEVPGGISMDEAELKHHLSRIGSSTLTVEIMAKEFGRWVRQ